MDYYCPFLMMHIKKIDCPAAAAAAARKDFFWIFSSHRTAQGQ